MTGLFFITKLLKSVHKRKYFLGDWLVSYRELINNAVIQVPSLKNNNKNLQYVDLNHFYNMFCIINRKVENFWILKETSSKMSFFF